MEPIIVSKFWIKFNTYMVHYERDIIRCNTLYELVCKTLCTLLVYAILTFTLSVFVMVIGALSAWDLTKIVLVIQGLLAIGAGITLCFLLGDWLSKVLSKTCYWVTYPLRLPIRGLRYILRNPIIFKE